MGVNIIEELISSCYNIETFPTSNRNCLALVSMLHPLLINHYPSSPASIWMVTGEFLKNITRSILPLYLQIHREYPRFHHWSLFGLYYQVFWWWSDFDTIHQAPRNSYSVSCFNHIKWKPRTHQEMSWYWFLLILICHYVHKAGLFSTKLSQTIIAWTLLVYNTMNQHNTKSPSFY